MRIRFRLLPIVIFLGALTLTLKVGSLWQGVELIGSPPASAAAGLNLHLADPRNDIVLIPATADTNSKSGNAARSVSARGDRRSKRGADVAKATSPAFDPTTATDAELAVLEKLSARRSVLDQRARDLELRENLLKATESRVDSKIAELRRIKQTLKGLLKKYDAEEEAKMRSLVKIYENMKPKSAARIMERLDLKVLLSVVERMREGRTAPILAKMDPAKAKVLTTALAARRTLPKVTSNSQNQVK